MWYQLSPFPIAPMRRLQCSTTQATFTNPSLLRATPLLRGMFYFNYPMKLTRYRNDGGVRKPSIFHLSTSFPKQILTPSRFKLILLIKKGIDRKDHDSCSFWAENFGRSLEGQGEPTRGSKVFNTIIQIEADHLRENPPTPQQQETLPAITLGCKRRMRLLLAANNQATRRNEIIKSCLLGSSSNRYAPRVPQQETKSSTKLLAPTDPILGPENLLKTGFAQRGLPSN